LKIYSQIVKGHETGKKQFAILVDPDKTDDAKISELGKRASDCEVDFIFVGGSLLTNSNLSNCISKLKSSCNIPVIIFPGNIMQIDKNADAILFLSLISGRNPDLLIGKHVIAAPILKENNLETIATGYMLVESGNFTTVQYMSNTRPIPAEKNEIAVCTAMAGEMLGLKTIYMDAGSGATNPVSEKMIESVRKNVSIPIIIGGGIRTPEKAVSICKAGADVVVVGNSIEKDFSLIKTIADAVHKN